MADSPAHGEVSTVSHVDDPLFAGIPKVLNVVRYHSWVVDTKNHFPSHVLSVIASTTDKDICMAIKHKLFPLYGVQFHPESVCTEYGSTLMRNFVKLATRFNMGRKMGPNVIHRTDIPAAIPERFVV